MPISYIREDLSARENEIKNIESWPFMEIIARYIKSMCHTPIHQNDLYTQISPTYSLQNVNIFNVQAAPFYIETPFNETERG